MTNNETKKITVSSKAACSVGGAYYTDYTLEDKEYKIGEIVKATITEHCGPNSHTEEVDLEITEDLIQAIENEREHLKKEEYFNSIRVSPSLHLYQLCDDIDSTLAAHVEAQRVGTDSIYSSLCEYVEDTYDVYDEDGDLDFDKEREIIYKMSEKEIRDIVENYDMEMETFYTALEREIDEYEENEEDLEDEDYLHKKKLYDDYPSVYLLLTDKQIEEMAESQSESGYIKIGGYEYLYIDSF